MAGVNPVLDSFDLKGVDYKGLINEDVMQKIYDISEIPLPLTSRIGTDKVRNSYKEWTVDDLGTPDVTNAVVDGSDAADATNVVGARVGNHCQISVKQLNVSTRARNSDTIGYADALAYQVMRGQQRLKRDVEAIMLTSQASVADGGSDSSTPGKSGGLGAWLVTNTSRGAGAGANGGFAGGVVAAPVAGTKRAISETAVRDVAEKVYIEGGNPNLLMSTPTVIRKLSNYMFTSSARIATAMSDVGQKAEAATAVGAVNVFVTDFNIVLEMIPNRLQQTETGGVANAYIITPSMLSLGLLMGYRTEPLGKTGLYDKRQVAVDWTLIVKTEKAHGVIADIDPALPGIQ